MAFKLHGEVSLDGSGFRNGLHGLGREAHAFAGQLKTMAMAAFGFYGIEQAISKTVDRAENLVNVAKRMGTTVEWAQVLQKAAKDGNVELDAMANAMEKINETRSKALGGDRGALAAFGKLGISQSDLSSKSASDLLTGPISRAAQSQNVESLGPILKEVLGEGFGELIPVLQSDFEGMIDEVGKYGMSGKTAYSLKELKDSFELITDMLIGVFAPAILKTAEIFVKIFAGLSATWTYLSSLLGDSKSTTAMHQRMMSQPGFGGYTPGQTHMDKVKPLNESDDKIAKEFAKNQAVQEFSRIMGLLDDFKARVAKGVQRSQDQPIANYQDAVTPKKFAERTDSMVQVGNFLGAARNPLQELAQRQVVLQEQMVQKLTILTSRGNSSSWVDDNGLGVTFSGVV